MHKKNTSKDCDRRDNNNNNNNSNNDKWYEHKPETVVENKQAIILWNMPIHTDGEIRANKPDIIKDVNIVHRGVR